MRVVPTLKVARLNQLEPGDLFIGAEHKPPCVGLKGVDPECDGDPIVVWLGPNLLDKLGPRVTAAQHETVIAIGKDYVLRLPTEPEGWTTEFPPPASACVSLADDKAFFRGNFVPEPDAFKPCWIEAESGILRYKPPPGITAYAVNWEIVIEEPMCRQQTVLRVA